MRAFKLLMVFVIYFFIITAINGMINLAKWISFGNKWIEYGFYVFMLILFILYFAVPILKYLSKPSLKNLELMYDNDSKSFKRIRRYLKKTLVGQDNEVFSQFSKDQEKEIKEWVRDYIVRQGKELDKIINRYAFKLTSTVLISPNSFIDGIAILYVNSIMIYNLSKTVKFRYSWKDLLNMYFSVFAMASVSGLMEEFDDEIEEIIKEFVELISKETTKSVGDSLPFINVAVKATSIVFQAAGNYAFAIYNGNRFKYRILNVIGDNKLSNEEIEKVSRKEARKSKYAYIKGILKNPFQKGTATLKNLLINPRSNEQYSVWKHF